MQKVGEIARKRVERIVFESELMRSGFAAFPYLVMRDKKLSIAARLTYAFLLMYAWQEGSCFTRQTKIWQLWEHMMRYFSVMIQGIHGIPKTLLKYRGQPALQ